MLFYDDIVGSADSLQFFTDAAPSIIGGYYRGNWFGSNQFLVLPQSSALSDLYTIVVGCFFWRQNWQSKCISILSDSEAAVCIISKGCSSSPVIMPFLRHLTWFSVTLNFIIRARHIPGYKNALANSSSHFNVVAN